MGYLVDSSSPYILGVPEPMTALRTGVPMELEVFGGKCLKKDAKDRYDSASDIAKDLRSLGEKLKSGRSTILKAAQTHSEPVGARRAAPEVRDTGSSISPEAPDDEQPDSALAPYRVIETLDSDEEALLYRAQDTNQNRSVAIRIVPESAAQQLEKQQRLKQATLTAAVAMIALLVGAVAAVQIRGPSAPPEMPLRRFSLTPEHYPLSGRAAGAAVISPDGTHIAYAAGVDGPRLWIRDLDREEPRTIEGTDGGQWPVWSPDSEFIFLRQTVRSRKFPPREAPRLPFASCLSLFTLVAR